MPLFDYTCMDCKRRFSLLLGVVAQSQEEKCPNCGSTNISRLLSRFGRLRSEDDLMDDLADPSKIGDLDNPKELHGWMKRVGREMGEDFDGILEEPEVADDGLPDEEF